MKPSIIPSHRTAPEFGKVTIVNTNSALELEFTILMEPQGRDAEGWRTGIALDSSSSMQEVYGRRLLGKVPDIVLKEYEAKNWIEYRIADGRKLRVYEEAAYADAIERGFLKFTNNLIQPYAQGLIGYLAGNLDTKGETSVIYWACGQGNQIEIIGDIDEEKASSISIVGPIKTSFGIQTCLLPALDYFVKRFCDAKRGMYLFITDGRIDDLEEVIKYSIQLAKQIYSGNHYPIKCVLIGLGDKIDPSQMEALDMLDPQVPIDIWDCKYAKEMRSLRDIFAEVVNENQIVAPNGILYDDKGNVIKKYTDGLPARIKAILPLGCTGFELEVMGQRISQSI